MLNRHADWPIVVTRTGTGQPIWCNVIHIVQSVSSCVVVSLSHVFFVLVCCTVTSVPFYCLSELSKLPLKSTFCAYSILQGHTSVGTWVVASGSLCIMLNTNFQPTL